MKNLKLLTFIFLMFTLTNCNNDDDSDNPNDESNLQGSWNMIKAYGGISGAEHIITEGTVVWTFNIQANTINVVNNNTDGSFDGGLATGNYDYEITDSQAPESCAKTLRIDNSDYGCYMATNSGLTISQVYADGLIYDFVSAN